MIMDIRKRTAFSLAVGFILIFSSFIMMIGPYTSPAYLNQFHENQPSLSEPDINKFESSPSIDSQDFPRGTRSGDEIEMALKWIDGYGTVMGYLESIKSADVDNDGEFELVFGNSEGYIYVLGDSSEGLFEEWSTMVGTGAFGLSLDDVDNDGTIEIIVGDMDGYLSIFGFNGTTYLLEWKSADLGSQLFGLTTADVDDDGTIEIIAGASVSEIFDDDLFVFSWQGTTYYAEWSYALSPITPNMGYLGIFNIDVGDVNYDGSKEIVVATYESEVIQNDPPINPIPPNPKGNGQSGGRFYVFLYNHGSGSLERWSDDFGEWILGMGIDDTDADGDLEIVISLYFGSVYVFGYVSILSVYRQLWSVDISAYALSVGDIDGDDMGEIIVSSWYDVFIYKNQGSEMDYAEVWSESGFESIIYGLGNGHFDDDDTKELLIGSYYKLYIYGHDGITYNREVESNNIGAMESICAADVDMDGINEVLLGTGNGNVVVMGLSGLSWEIKDTISLSTTTITHLAVGDVDDDGQDEIIAIEGHSSTSWNENFVFRSAANDAVVYILEYSDSTHNIEAQIDVDTGATFTVEVGDVDEDNIPEILLGGTGYDAANEDPFVGQIEVVDFNGTGYEVIWESYFFSNWVMGVAIGDVDDDEKNEIVTEDYNENTEQYLLRIFEWNGITFTEPTTIQIESENFALDIGDIDGDDSEEIASKGIFSGLLEIFGRSGTSYSQEWNTGQFTTFIDECFGITNIEEGEDEFLIFGELGVFIYQFSGGIYQEIWHSAEVPASIKTIHVADVDKTSGKEIIGSSGGYNFIYGALKLPTAVLSVSKNTVEINEEVQFNGSLSTGESDLEYFFDFGDGNDTGWVSTPVVTHSYSTDRTYTASLRVRDERPMENDQIPKVSIKVLPPNQVPEAIIDYITPNPAIEDELVSFLGKGEDEGTIMEYEWRSNKDGIISTSSAFTTSTLSVGTHKIYFRVKDDRDTWSQSDTAILKIEKRNEIPIAIIDDISPNPAQTGELIHFSGHGEDDGSIAAYYWESDLEGFLSIKRTFSTASLSVGEHTISFKVKDNQEEWSDPSEQILTITVVPVNVLPVAYIDTISPEQVKKGEDMTFFGHGVDDDGKITDYYWESDIDGLLSDSRSFSTSDLSKGTHVITFRVKDDRGEWSEPVTTTVVVKSAGGGDEGFFDFSSPTENPMPFILLLIVIIIVVAVVIAIFYSGSRKKKREEERYYQSQRKYEAREYKRY